MLILRDFSHRLREPVALTIGNFDGIHLGHQAMLTRLAEMAGDAHLPACVLTFEPHPREYFNPTAAPVRLTSLREKLELLDQFGVDFVQLCRFNAALAALSPEDFITKILVNCLQVKALLVGDDFHFGAQRRGNFALLQQASQQYGFTVEAMHSVSLGCATRISSTELRTALARGDLNHANSLLGRRYTLSGRVVHGQKLGRQLGFPTANIHVKHNRLPLTGIYAVRVYGISDEPLQGAASLGTRPTVEAQGKASVEVFLLDFSQDIYGQTVTLEFMHYLRPEARYPDLATLTAQITADVAAVRAFFATCNAPALRPTKGTDDEQIF